MTHCIFEPFSVITYSLSVPPSQNNFMGISYSLHLLILPRIFSVSERLQLKTFYSFEHYFELTTVFSLILSVMRFFIF
jgi:hypothetical protein